MLTVIANRVVLLMAVGLMAPTVIAGFRPPAVPLVSVEPHFSVWSVADHLYDRETTHWSGQVQALQILLDANGRTYRLCGRQPGNLPVLEQKSVVVGATVTTYRFEDDELGVDVEFFTPRLTDDLDVFSRPVSYVEVRVQGARPGWSVKMSISDAFATNDDKVEMERQTKTIAGAPDVIVGRKVQRPFSAKGDGRRPDWGYVHLVGPFRDEGSAHYLLAYDNVKSVRYFGTDLVDWWRRGSRDFFEMLEDAERDYEKLRARCHAFDQTLRLDLIEVGGRDYAAMAELAWRQSFAACKFVAAEDGEPFLMSAENNSGGMIGTTDVFYPQFPHLLLTSITLAKASLAPTCIYAASTNWPYSYAPHDLGRFPVADGQWYGLADDWLGESRDDRERMPVEECGNMLICLAAIAKEEGNAKFAGRWWGEVRKWAEYIEQFGYDPGEQLCTDDFSGRLAHNANLSVKSIIALRAYAMMAGMRGDAAAETKYSKLARDFAAQWMVAARGGREGGTKIAFDRPDSWSQKYNLVWDRLLGFGLFPLEVAEGEIRAYRKLVKRYGLPLDDRKPYTKADWIIWSGSLTWKKPDLEFFAKGLYEFLDKTPDRVPFCDWYATDSALQMSFQARSVVGGVFLPMLQHSELIHKYRK